MKHRRLSQRGRAVNERVGAYIRSLYTDEEEFLKRLGDEARRDKVPIIKPETAALLKTLLTIKRPMNVLEVGTAVGYSAILMSLYIPEGGKITTIENYEKRIGPARKNICSAGKEDMITLLEGDAMKILPGLMPGYDFIFMDAAKGQYPGFLPYVMRLLIPGGVLVSDNVLQDGSIADSRYAIERRDRTIHTRMRDYLWKLTHNGQFVTSILQVGDGVAVSVKAGEM